MIFRSEHKVTALVVGITFVALLLAGAALFARSLYNLKTLNPGFVADQLLGFSLDPSLNGYSRERALTVFQRLEEELARLPDVKSATASVIPLMTDSNWSSTVKVEGYKAKEGEDMNPDVNGVGPGFFSTMGLPLIAGREFTVKDGSGAPRVAIINETMARQYWPGQNALGRRFRLGDPAADTPWRQIVGIVADVRQMGLDEPVKAEMYFPYQQTKEYDFFTPRDLAIRTSGDTSNLVSSVRQIVREVDPDQPVSNVATMAEVLGTEAAQRRMGMIMLAGFAALALLLASLGIYGVLAYFVTQHTNEIGVRQALGATPRNILLLVLRKGMGLTLLGVGIGLVAAFALTRLMSSLLFGVTAADPLTFATVPLVLVGVALLACYIPARRATKVDPIVALRYE